VCDATIFVDAPLEVRLERLAASRKWTAEMLAQREKKQNPLDFKRAKSDYVVCNKSSVSHLRQQVCLLYHRIVAPRSNP
jgi:dephospho-CoA kinase